MNRLSTLTMLGLVLAASAAIYAGSASREPIAAAEGTFLAFVTCIVLLCFVPAALAFGARSDTLSSPPPSARTQRVPVLFAGLVLALVVSAWALPNGAIRGSAMGFLLALCPLFLGSLLADTRRSRPSLDLALWLPAAVGLQLLFRVTTLVPLELSVRSLVTWFLLPCAGVVFARQLSRRHGASAAAVAVLAVVLVCGGFTVNGVFALAALAAAQTIERTIRRSRQQLRTGPWRTAVPTGLFGALALLLAWDPVRGAILLMGALYFVVGRGWAAILFVIAGVLAVWTEPRAWSLVLGDLATLGFLFPVALAVIVSIRLGGGSIGGRLGLPAALLAVVALRSLEPVDALAMPAAILALSWFGRGRVGDDPAVDRAADRRATLRPAAGRLARPSILWLLLLVVVTAILAGYPWLRWPDLGDTIGRLTDFDAARAGVLWLLVAATVWLSASLGAGRWTRRLSVGVPAALLLGCAFLVAAPYANTAVLVDWPPVRLDGSHPLWSIEISDDLVSGEWPAAGARLWVESTLVDSAGTAAGSPALEIRLRPPSGEERVQVLRQGRDTGEWAAARDGNQSPRPWISWVAPSRGFFGQAYRSELELGSVPSGSRLEIARARGLPEQVSATVYRVVLLPGRPQ